ncbi:MAG TPA: dephospho-CoA kinase [Stellaceae bacterium]|nr:dephospho-CoA kinase [Stellaceae bacterium]
MIILGLTGSIGMGKSAAATTLRRLGVPLFDADAEVHRLLAPGGEAVAVVEAAFPGVRSDGGEIDRRLLGQRVFRDPPALRRLEGILHPMVRRAERRFVARARARRASLVVLDIPLLFESGGVERCNFALVVSAPLRLQRERVMRRAGMSESRFADILRAQLPDHEKRRRADFVVATALGRSVTFRRLKAIVRTLRQRELPRRLRRGRACAKL